MYILFNILLYLLPYLKPNPYKKQSKVRMRKKSLAHIPPHYPSHMGKDEKLNTYSNPLLALLLPMHCVLSQDISQ